MKTEWTPGPWAEHIQGEDGKAIGVYAEAGRHSIVHMAVGNPDSNANAHLIAAAPTMFEALTEIQKLCARLLDMGTEEDHSFGEIDDIVSAALLKASPTPDGSA